jgi:heme exporter protein B
MSDSATLAAIEPRRQPPGWLGQTLIVLRKDLAIELSTGEVVVTSGFFGLLIVVLSSLAFYGGAGTQRLVGAGVIWVSLCFSAVLALGKTWQRERDEGALDGLLVMPLSRSAIFAGKALGVLGFLLAIAALVIPLAALLFALDLTVVGPGLVCVALCAAPGLAASGTLFGAMTVRTQARDLLLAVVLFPLLTPTLLCAVAATRELFGGATLNELGDYFQLMAVFDLVFVSGGLGLFGSLIER